MENQDWVNHCNEVNGLLGRIREQLPKLLTTAEEKYFDELLSANELGAAFDFLCDKLDGACRPLSQSVFDLLMTAANKMQYAPESLKRFRVTS